MMPASVPLLRPMTVGDLLDQAIRIYRRNWVTAVGVVAVITLPLLLIQNATLILAFPSDLFSVGTSTAADPTPLLVYGLVSLITGLLAGIGFVFQVGALAVVVSESYFGNPVSIRAAYGRVLRRALPLLAAIGGLFLFDMAVISFSLVPFFGTMLALTVGPNGPAAAVLTFLSLVSCVAFPVALVLLLLVNVFMIFTPQAIVLENTGLVAGVRRSWNLVRGSFWRVLGILIILYFFISIVSAVPAGTISVGATVFLRSFVLVNVIQTVISGLVGVLLAPIQYAVLTLLYYDLRVRKEGFDLELLARQLGQEVNLAVTPPA